MASIYPNRKNGKIISFKSKAYLGRDENGKQVFKCTTWIPDKTMSEGKLTALVEKEATIAILMMSCNYEVANNIV